MRTQFTGHLMKKLRELAVDEAFEIFVLVKDAGLRTAKNGKKFIAFTFQDTSGTLDGMYWDAKEEDVKRFQPGTVVLLNGKRETYQGRPQVKILRMRPAEAGEPASPQLYVEKAPVQTEQMVEEFNQVLFSIENVHWNRIVRYLLKEYQEQFFTYPAAKKNHHAFRGGLAYHTLTMLHLGQAVTKEYPSLDASLLYAGIILHDLGKVLELSGPVGTEYTVAGNLIGHLVLVDEAIIKACLALKINDQEEDVLLLRHMVLSHHGLLEYGSPVRPKLMEAEVLHHLDDLDASLQMMRSALKQTEPGQFSERIFGLDGRSFYRAENPPREQP